MTPPDVPVAMATSSGSGLRNPTTIGIRCFVSMRAVLRLSRTGSGDHGQAQACAPWGACWPCPNGGAA